MITEEANKIIAEFMSDTQRTFNVKGDKLLVQDYIELKWHDVGLKPYSKSLDAQVPVWEKIKNDTNLCVLVLEMINQGLHKVLGLTIQEAAAIATAKAILELK